MAAMTLKEKGHDTLQRYGVSRKAEVAHEMSKKRQCGENG